MTTLREELARLRADEGQQHQQAQRGDTALARRRDRLEKDIRKIVKRAPRGAIIYSPNLENPNYACFHPIDIDYIVLSVMQGEIDIEGQETQADMSALYHAYAEPIVLQTLDDLVIEVRKDNPRVIEALQDWLIVDAYLWDLVLEEFGRHEAVDKDVATILDGISKMVSLRPSILGIYELRKIAYCRFLQRIRDKHPQTLERLRKEIFEEVEVECEIGPDETED